MKLENGLIDKRRGLIVEEEAQKAHHVCQWL
jgi:hypothetical protein